MNHVVFNKVPKDATYYVTGNKSTLLCLLMLQWGELSVLFQHYLISDGLAQITV